MQQESYWIDPSALFVPEFQQCFEELFQLWQGITVGIPLIFGLVVSSAVMLFVV